MSVWLGVLLVVGGIVTGGIGFFLWLMLIWSRDFWQW